MVRNKKKGLVSDNQISSENPSSNFDSNSQSIEKSKINNKKKLTKTQEIPPKPRSNIQGYNIKPKKGIKEPKVKVNPWRNQKINGCTDTSQMSKQED